MNLSDTRLMKLTDLPRGSSAVVVTVDDARPKDPIAQRLRELGFVRGEPVRLVTRGPFGGDPVLVQVGFTRFALRRAEAARVTVDAAAVLDPIGKG